MPAPMVLAWRNRMNETETKKGQMTVSWNKGNPITEEPILNSAKRFYIQPTLLMRWGLPEKIALSFSQASHPLLLSWDIMPRLKIGCDSSLCLWGCQSMPGWNCFPRFNLLFMLFLKFLNFKILIFIEVWLIYSCFLLRWSVCLKFLPTLKLGCLSYQVMKVLYIIYLYINPLLDFILCT